MKRTKKILCAVLVLVMALSLCLPALADKTYKPYKYYMCIGDSIAAGCSLTKDGSETYFDQNTDDYTTVYSPDYIYYGYDYETVPTAYHSIVNNALGTKLIQNARSGLRAVELRYILEGVYNDYDSSHTWGNTYFDVNGDGTFTLADLDKLNEKAGDYKTNIKKADVMSLNLGSNDVMSFTMVTLMNAMQSDTLLSPLADRMKEFLGNGGSIGEAFVKMLDGAKMIGAMPRLAALLPATLTRAYTQFAANYDKVVADIYELNPDITIVGVGVFNPFEHVNLSQYLGLDLSALIAPVVLQINSHIRQLAGQYDNFYYADVVGTETYDMSFRDRYFAEYMTLKVHPTLAGHKFMAERILAALPAADEMPFTDVPKGAWYYDSVYYAWQRGLVNGMTPTTFEPEGTTTRAQAITVIYRMAGSPNVTPKRVFNDVPQGFWAEDAITWGYENGVINGYSPTQFGPNDYVTREQFVAMLYRAEGSPITSGSLSGFTDSGSIFYGFRNAFTWATANGIIAGFEDQTIRPGLYITRAQMATILARFDRMYN